MRPIFRRLRAFGLFLAGGGLFALSCGPPDYEFVPGPDGGVDGPIEPSGPSAPVPCEADDDCSGLSATRVCDAMGGYCVECDPTREEELERCGEGLFCGVDGRCAVGCVDDSGCRGITCDLERGLCTGCTGDQDCTPGTTCVGAVCTPGCADGATCPSAWLCCNGQCENPLTSLGACGSCGVSCAEDGECTNGVCGSKRCEAPSAECDGDAETVCETDTTSDPNNCGRCRLTCASGLCSGGVCTTMGCAEGTADCNQQESDQCEADLFAIEDCLVCGKSCSELNGTATCTSEGCAIVCSEGFGDCDEDPDTGCETSLLDDADSCGACGVVCRNEHGSTRCTDGVCEPRCGQGFADCDGVPENGCETDTDASESDCGACGARCNPEHGSGTCDQGACTVSCDEGFADCNGDPADGCEADLAAPETCGSCDNRCSETGGIATCTDGECAVSCLPGFLDCTGGVADGCETNIAQSPSNCGACGAVCPSDVGTAVCNDGECGISTCTYPYEECITGDDEICETELRETDEYCGDCGTDCTTLFKNGDGSCAGGSCVLGACEDGFADCNGLPDDGCEAVLGTAATCRNCGEHCLSANGTNACTSDGCRPVCQSGWGDCDGNPDNGCETPLDTLFNCGGCGVPCSKAHASESCESGSCEIVACDTGWGDCNDEATANGCETQLNTLANCGACGVMCDLAGGSESCGTGQCVLTGCNAGRADCTSQAGCETTLGTTSNCLGCGDACEAVNGTNTCNPTTGCNPVCSTGYKSCDGDRGNGCETNIRTLANCGDCGVGCDLPHATESCSTGTCSVTSCEAGWFDCSDSAAGCETQAGTTTNCSACGAGCVNAHGGAQCNAGSCSYTCNTGWDACDGNASNGCETSIRSLTDCGSCGKECDIGGSGETCATGSCEATICDPNTADCDMNGTSCETVLGTTMNCLGCGDTCSPVNGTNTCNTSSGCTPVCNAGFKSCDSNSNNGCERSIRTNTDCGDCNVPCDFPNSTESCSTGTCRVGTCNAGYADCDGSDTTACIPLGTSTNCASCGNACTNSHGSNACTGAVGSYDCSPTCSTGWKSCDGNPDNGCEKDVRTLTDCGDCGVACSFSHGGESCTTGTCTMTGCDAGWGDCTPGGDCETQLNSVNACGSCNVQCTNANGSTACTSGACVPTCNTGFKSCDSNPNNGCERNIRTTTDCGDCGVTCSFPNASASCSTGTCTMGSCNTDFGNCTASPGCETQLNTVNACGSCSTQCTNSHGTTACSGSAGSRVCNPTCSSGWGNCDGDPNDGCETDLTTPSHCGSCGNACSGNTPYCVNGSCSATAPSICSQSGWALCDDFQDGNANGWSPTGGTWTVTTDLTFVYRYAGESGSQRSIIGTSSWTNQTILSRVKVTRFDDTSSSFRAGILGRYGGSTSYYTFQFDGSGNLNLRRGTSTISGSGCGTVTPSSPLSTNTWYWLKMQISGGTNATRIVTSWGTNGTTFTTAQDCSITSGTLDSGNVGVITVGANTTAVFDEFAVTIP